MCIFGKKMSSNLPNKRVRDLVRSISIYAVKIFQVLCKTESNLVFSPPLLASILALCATGAKSHTESQILSAIHLTKVKKLVDEFRILLDELKDLTNANKLIVASKIFADQIDVYPSFENNARNEFDSDIEEINFDTVDTTVQIVNDWIDLQTEHWMKMIVDADVFQKRPQLLLLTAACFNASEWKYKFTNYSKTISFTNQSGDLMDCVAMESTGLFLLDNNDNLDAHVIEIPYANNSISLMLIVPYQIDGLTSVEIKIPSDLSTLRSKLVEKELFIVLPKFQLERSINFVDVLQKHGMQIPLTEKAEFNSLSIKKTYISHVLQRIHFEVTTSSDDQQQENVDGKEPDLIVDRPFIFLVFDNPTGCVLFLGHVDSLS